MEIERDRAKRTLKISQKRLLSELLDKYEGQIGRLAGVPLTPGLQLNRKDGNPLDTSKYHYAELVGSLLYLSVCTRPDITQAVAVLTRYMSNPLEPHYKAAQTVLGYLSGTMDLGLMFNVDSPDIGAEKYISNIANLSPVERLYGYSDSDFAGDPDTRKSTTGYVFLYGGAAISWSSKLQAVVAQSTTEAEYIAAATAAKEALWLRQLYSDLWGKIIPVHLLCDNLSTLHVLKNPISSQRTKHIDIRYHFIRQRIAQGEFVVEYCNTDYMLADTFTKALSKPKHHLARDRMSVM